MMDGGFGVGMPILRSYGGWVPSLQVATWPFVAMGLETRLSDAIFCGLFCAFHIS